MSAYEQLAEANSSYILHFVQQNSLLLFLSISSCKINFIFF